MLKVNREERKHGDVLPRYQVQGCSKGVAPPWSVQGSSALYGLILRHSVTVNHPQPLTTWVGSSTSSARWSPSSQSPPSHLGDAITKSNKHELSLDHDKPNEKGGCTLCYSCFHYCGLSLGFSNLNHLTRTLLFLALSKVFLSCWNELKYPLTRMEEVFIQSVEKQTIMCLYRVTGRSGHVGRTLRLVLPELQC